MKYMLLVLSTLLLLVSHKSHGFTHQSLPHIYYVSFPAMTPDGELTVSGQYRVPRRQDTSNPMPAVVIVHSSGGVDSTGGWYAQSLNDSGIATLEIDLWSPRGYGGGTDDRPDSVQETLPDVFGALSYLANRTEIDATKIGLIGFSWGGVAAMLSATQPYYDLMGDGVNQFAGFVAHYPLCWTYNTILPGFEFTQLTGQPILIQVGSEDDYEDDPKSCKRFVRQLPNKIKKHIKVVTYRGAHHGWDRLEPALNVFDPFGYQGRGGLVDIAPNYFAAIKSKHKVNKFFNKLFK